MICVITDYNILYIYIYISIRIEGFRKNFEGPGRFYNVSIHIVHIMVTMTSSDLLQL